MTNANRLDIRRAIDRYGADLSDWPDRALARAARVAALADGEVRAWLDESRALTAALATAAVALDRDIEKSGAVGRVADAVLAKIADNPQPRVRWVAVAATLLLAAGLGGAVQFTLETSVGQAGVDVVVLDPLVFGPAGIDQ